MVNRINFNLEKAIEFFMKALEIYMAKFGNDNKNSVTTLRNLKICEKLNQIEYYY